MHVVRKLSCMMVLLLKRVITTLKYIFKWFSLKLNQLLIVILALVIVCVLCKVWCGHREEQLVPRELRNLVRFQEGYTLPLVARNQRQLDQLAARIDRLNRDAEIYNWNRWGAHRDDTDIFLIQVHKDVERLQYLIVALGQVRYIKKAMLIFSHSYYDDKINRLIRSIRFAKVMQIYYPYSMQLNPDKFPGADSEDCNGSVACVGRDARRAEHKHHWWWKAHYVFHGFDWSEKHRGMVVFLEENDYVLPDLLYMLKYARQAISYFSSAYVVSFGRAWVHGLDHDTLTVDAWHPPYEKGLTFNRTTWLKIAALASHFCFYDDASWSSSLVHLFERFPKGYSDMVATTAPRVVSTRTFSSGRVAAATLSIVAKDSLFPRSVRAVVSFSSGAGGASRVRHVWRGARPAPAGGWADLRDHLLCLDPLLATTTETLTDTTYMFEQSINKNVSNSL
ncbi:unnamed protein product [Chilo suppressalis]|uniref:Alpha-1,6-mannosyl-glycoprotein 2-beta-N-acetylglucosaminyltransferase n=1 Tax=Chilo suppressalis TaxID=168631 RepID=A0ABN8L5A7_CHISP|nr:unnamed protein product [Chilo suppressalis]